MHLSPSLWVRTQWHRETGQKRTQGMIRHHQHHHLNWSPVLKYENLFENVEQKKWISVKLLWKDNLSRHLLQFSWNTLRTRVRTITRAISIPQYYWISLIQCGCCCLHVKIHGMNVCSWCFQVCSTWKGHRRSFLNAENAFYKHR